MPKKLTTEEFIRRAKLVPQHQGKPYNYSKVEYIKTLEKVEIICLDHGPFWQRPTKHLSGKGCHKCAGKPPLTNESVDLRLVGRRIQRLGNIKGGANKVLWKCLVPECGHEWLSSPSHVLHGDGCRKCAGTLLLTNSDVDARITHRCIKRIGDIKSTGTKIYWLCLKDSCGHEWPTTPKNILAGKGCPRCAKYGFNPSKPAVLYVYRIAEEYCGYGISNNFKKRNYNHKKSFKKAKITAELVATYDCSGFHAEKIENLLKKSFKVVNTGIDGFKREATHIENLPIVLDFINDQLKQC